MARQREQTLSDLLPRRAAEAPGTLAFVVDGSGALSYSEWDRRSNAAARGLDDRGVGPGDRVVLWFDAGRWADFAVAYAGVHKRGAVPVVLASWVRPGQLARVAAGSSAATIVSGDLRFPAQAPPPPVPLVAFENLEVDQDDAPLPNAQRAGDLAEVAYRCGFLAPLEGRERPASDVVSALAAEEAAAAARSAIHSFAAGTDGATEALWFPLPLARGPVVVLPAFEPERFSALAAEHGVERWCLTPATALWLLESGALDRHDRSAVSQLVLDGGRPSPALLGRLAARVPGASVISVVGPSGRRVAYAYDPRRPGSVGRRLGPQSRPPAPAGELGRVELDDQASALGYTDEGFLYLVHGEGDVVRRATATVAEADVVGALRRHPAVADAAVVAMPGDDAGADRVVAAVALRSPAEPAELAAAARHELGEERAPDSIVVVDRVPRNRRGLALKARLRADVNGATEEPPAPAEPQGDVEETIAAVFERVLGRPGVGAHDDFFELGGDQLGAVEVVSLLEEALDVRLPPWAVLDAPTVSGLASRVDRARREGAEGAGSSGFVPLAASQEGMVWHEQFAPGSQNLPPLVRRYRGPLDPALFERALGEIVRRHEPLRTTFRLHEGRAVQVVSPPAPLSLRVRDLAGLPGDEQEDALAQVLADAGRPFDLVDGPLFEPTLLRLGPEDHVVVFRVHHSVYDDWSVGVFRAELSALYAAMAAGEPPPLDDLPVPFSTFARRQRRRLAGPAGAAQLRWWREALRGGPLDLELPVDDPDRPEGAAQPSAEPVSIDLAPELSAHLRALARRQRATPFMAVLAAFEVLVHRYTGHADLLLASVVANRNRTELEGMVGCFTKKVLLRQAVPGDPTFADVLGRARSVLLGALSNQDLPFETVVQDALGPAAAMHGLAPSPVVMVQGVTPQAQDVVLPGIATSGYETSATTRRTHFRGGSDEEPPDALDWGAGLYRGTFLILSVAEHDDHISLSARGAFHRPAVERLLANFATLLADAVAHPFRPVSELALVDPAERALLAVASGADADVIDRCLHHLFDDQVARSPSRVAIDAGPTRLTFAELAARADELATRLRAAGAGPGTLVGLCLPPSIDCVVGVLGIWKAGAAYVGLDPEDAGGGLADVVAQASPAAVVAPPGVRHPVLAEAHIVDVDTPDRAGAGTPPADLEDARPSEPALAFHGAGASAVPAGVVLSHRSVAALVAGLRRDVWPAEPPVLRVALSARPTEDAFLRQLVALLDGHTLRVASPEPLPGADVDLVDGPPDQVETSGAAVVVVGTREPTGAPPRGEGATVRHLFGPPECAFGAGLVTTGPGGRRLLTPLAGVNASVLDRAGQTAPIGATGELHMSRPDEPGWHSGLLARHRPDSTVELAGKASDVIRLRGFDVDRAELEAVLRRHPEVREARVALDASGEQLVAHVVPESGRAPTLADLQLHVWTELPGYAWPSVLVVEAGAEPAVDVLVTASTTTAGSEALPEAVFLAALWAEVLGVEQVPADANYWQRFSFLEVVSRARAAGAHLSDEQVTRNRTLATLGADMAAQRLVEMTKTAR